MNELLKAPGLLKYMSLASSGKYLKLIRKMLMLFSVLLLITACVEYYSSGFNIKAIGELALSTLMFTFAQRIEVMLLKRKVNKWLMSNASINAFENLLKKGGME